MSNIPFNVYILPPYLQGDPEVKAMLQAFYSRSPKPIEERIKELGTDLDSIKKKLHQYAIGYGHSSILQNGHITLFVENIPINVAVAIEDHPLFAGQEVSTRYVDFSSQSFYNPFDGEEGKQFDKLMTSVRCNYIDCVGAVKENFMSKYSHYKDDTVAMRAINARVFDICRGVLPVAATTSVAWTGSMESISRHLRLMLLHPDLTISSVARLIYDNLEEAFPYAFKGLREISLAEATGYWEPFSDKLDYENTIQYKGEFGAGRIFREKYEMVPRKYLGETVRCKGPIDYGSYRDLNRHRPGNKSPVYPRPFTGGFHAWYSRTLKEHGVDSGTDEILKRLIEASSNIHNRYITPYFALLGNVVSADYQMDIGQFAYLVELRTGMSVHPTLRYLVNDWALQFNMTDRMRVYANVNEDPGPFGFIMARGNQTITISMHNSED